MIDLVNSPGVVVRIGQESRAYSAFITSAPIRLDAPATMTLHASRFRDIALFAANETPLDPRRGPGCGRLVLVDVAELPWQRARCREEEHLLVAADAVLISPDTLQRWLWRRLRRPGLVGDVPGGCA